MNNFLNLNRSFTLTVFFTLSSIGLHAVDDSSPHKAEFERETVELRLEAKTKKLKVHAKFEIDEILENWFIKEPSTGILRESLKLFPEDDKDVEEEEGDDDIDDVSYIYLEMEVIEPANEVYDDFSIEELINIWLEEEPNKTEIKNAKTLIAGAIRAENKRRDDELKLERLAKVKRRKDRIIREKK